MDPTDDLGRQLLWLVMLSLPVACVAWTITHEEVFRELRDFCNRRRKAARSLAARKFFYLFTCEYCFSHYMALAAVLATGFRLLYSDWRGMVIGGFALVWLANLQMSLFALLRLTLKSRRRASGMERRGGK